MHFLVIYGSLSEESINKKLAKNIKKLAPEGVEVELSGIEGFPLYSKDLEDMGMPEIATAYKEKVRVADGVIIVTPEYNRSMPGALKNVIDWTSRGENVPWKQKAVAVTGASDGLRGASFAQYDAKKMLSYLDAHIMGQPELYMGQFDKKIDPEGNIIDEKTNEVLVKFLNAFVLHVQKLNS